MKKQLALFFGATILAVLISGCVGIPDLLTMESVTGSGNVFEQEYDLSGFTAVSIGSAFAGEVEYGEEYRVVVRVDDNVLPDVRVTVTDNTLQVGLAPRMRVNTSELHVTITMPAIEAITLHGASRIALDGFANAPTFVADVAGAGELTGTIDADDIRIRQNGASRVTLAGEGMSLSVNLAGASVANLVDLTVATADVTLAGASKAEITASGTVDLVAGGASALTYGGGATLARSNLSGASTARER